MQSEHLTHYASALETLKSRGLVYPCFLSRKAVIHAEQRLGHSYMRPQTASTSAILKDTKSKLAAGEPHAWRLSMSAAREQLGAAFENLTYTETGYGKAITRRVDAQSFGDVILARKDISVSYHLACTYDDALQNITHVVRGQDLEETTGIHILLQALMGWPSPIYHHHRLLLKPDGNKLSKRSGDASIRALRESGHSPKAVFDIASQQISP